MRGLPGDSNHFYRHGMCNSRTWRSWSSMLARCSNPNTVGWNLYGGRGISVCERWRTFENFYADMGDRPDGMTLDRKNNDGNYEPGNCRWATRSQQMKNRRTEGMARGAHHHNSKASEQQARDMRANYALCRVTLKELADRYGLSVSQTHNIATGKHWRHL